MFEKIRQYVKDDEFRLTVFNDKIHVINYKEILSLEDERISFLTDKFRIIIKGSNLTVNKLLDREILIIGVIYGIEVSYD